MSGLISQAVWRSDLPDFLKYGLAGKLAAIADKSGGKFFPGAITINYLIDHCRYGKKNPRRFCRQTIKNHLGALVRCGFLTITSHGAGRGHYRTYELHPDALTAVAADDPMLRPAHRRVGKGPEGRILVTRRPWKGDNKGPTDVDRSESRPELDESPPHGPPPGTWIPPMPRRWDAVRTPDKNYRVMVKLAHTYIAKLPDAVSSTDAVEGFKQLVADLLPGQLLNSGQIHAALDSAAYRRRMLGIPVPPNVGANGQSAFALHRQQQASYARVDARRT